MRELMNLHINVDTTVRNETSRIVCLFLAVLCKNYVPKTARGTMDRKPVPLFE